MGAWHTSKAATNENTGGCDVSKVTTKDQTLDGAEDLGDM